jgi:hypothetical protein
MGSRTFALGAVLAVGLFAAGNALAREPFDGAFFVRHGGTAAGMLQDRDDCSREALSLGSTAAAYSDPNYGPLAAMGQALDSDALHEGGLHKRLRRAVFADCMKRRGWTPLDPDRDEAKAVNRASLRHPEALDAWLKAHEPPEVLAAAPPSPAQPTPAVAPSSAPPANAKALTGSATPH